MPFNTPSLPGREVRRTFPTSVSTTTPVPTSTQTPTPTTMNVLGIVNKKVVKIISGTSGGRGVLVESGNNETSYVLTNRHVIETHYRVTF